MPTEVTGFLLFLLPFIAIPFGVSPFETIKVILFLALTGIFAIRALWKNSRQFIQSPPSIPVIFLSVGIFGFILGHFFLSPTPLALFGNQYRNQGVLLTVSLLMFSLFSCRIHLDRLNAHLPFLLLCLHFLLALSVTPTIAGRAIGMLGEPNALAGTILFLWPFLYFAPKSLLKPVFVLLGGSVTILTILLTGSRSGLLGLGLQVFYIFAVKVLRIHQKMAVVLSGILMLLFIPFPFFSHSVYENRTDIWKIAVVAGANHWLFGNGVGTIETSLKDSAIRLGSASREYYIDSSHNIMLDWWVSGGIVGVFFFVCLLFVLCLGFIRKKQHKLLTAFFGLFTVLLFNPGTISLLIPLYWLIGQGIGYKEEL